MKIDPAAKCPCGSKKAYRDCCKPARDRSRTITFIVVFALSIVAARFLFKDEPVAPPGQVWSPEHGHYHDANAENQTVPPAAGTANSGAPAQATPNIPQPEGPVPAGKVWSPEHGHWHDVAPSDAAGSDPASAGNVPQPPGPVPPGKVWSPEHGHWHDVR